MPNEDLLQLTLDHITANPREWDQTQYAAQTECGTAGCFALWAIRLARPDAEPVWTSSHGFRRTATWVELGGGDMHCIPELAADLLGIDSRSADALFDECNSLADLTEYVSMLVGGEDIWPVYMERLG